MSPLTLEGLVERCGLIPELLQTCAERILDAPCAKSCSVTGWDVVGVGASEGPARMLVSALAGLGENARLCPITAFVGQGAASPDPAGRGLIVFSQGLSPNARLALRACSSYRYCLVITSVDPTVPDSPTHELEARGCRVLCHPPAREGGSLLRVMGPPSASLLALRWLETLAKATGRDLPWTSLAEAPDCYRRPWRTDARDAPAIAVDSLAGFVAVGFDVEVAPHLAWKWQEALYRPIPPVFDLLSFAHGPLQAFFSSPRTFVALRRAEGPRSGPLIQDLWHRFEESIDASGHRLVVLSTDRPGPLAFFDWDASWLEYLLGTMKLEGVTPGSWPGMTSDAALYRLGEEVLTREELG